MKSLKLWFISLVLSGYIVFLIYLLSTGTISKYINPRLSFLSVIALGMLAGMLFFSLRKQRERNAHAHHHCNCHHHQMENFRNSSLILLLPILLAFTVAPRILSYQTVNTGGLTQQSGINQPQPVSGTGKLSPENGTAPVSFTEYTQSNIGNLIFSNDASDLQKLVNTKIFLKGMVFHSDKLKPNEIIVYRVLITCCTADGMSLGILVKLPDKMDFPDDAWVGVEGDIQLLPITDELQNIELIANLAPLGGKYPYFTAKNAYVVPMPAEPYLYP